MDRNTPMSELYGQFENLAGHARGIANRANDLVDRLKGLQVATITDPPEPKPEPLATYTEKGWMETAEWPKHRDIPEDAKFVKRGSACDLWAHGGTVYGCYITYCLRWGSTHTGAAKGSDVDIARSRAARLRLPGFEAFDEPVLAEGEEWIAMDYNYRDLSTGRWRGMATTVCLIGREYNWHSCSGYGYADCRVCIIRHCTRHYQPGMVVKVVEPARCGVCGQTIPHDKAGQ